MQRALVCGAGGFIGGHLARHLHDAGWWVRGVDVRAPEFGASGADEFLLLDLRQEAACRRALAVGGGFDEVYQLAADMGGMGFIQSAEREVLRNNALVSLNMVDAATAVGVGRYFFSSSVCVYRDMAPGEPELTEEDAYPASPDNEYGWEKLYAERSVLAYARNAGLTARIARFQNCYGPDSAWDGGREKAPAALCRKVAEAPDPGTVAVWGDGRAVRSFIYVDDLVRAVTALMRSAEDRPTNIGTREYLSVDDLTEMIIGISGKDLSVEHVEGPVGVRSRQFSNDRIEALGWGPQLDLKAGMTLTYRWVEAQVAARST